MKKTLFTFIGISFCVIAFGQGKMDKKTAPIVAEGKKLYQSEMASWYGTDIFLERYGDLKIMIGGYFSYTENDTAKCVFFSKSEHPKVIGTIKFDSTYSVKTAILDSTERNFTSNELDLFTIRKLAIAEITSDTMFKSYKNTNYNIIPLIDKKEKKVFVLTGPKVDSVVIFGNDYLLTFNQKNKLIEKKKLHNNIITIKYDGEEDVISYHTHKGKTRDLITSTDICTLMLYEKFANWKQHYVMTEKYVCIWDCKTNRLVTLTKKAWDKINKGIEKHSKK